ncbi:dethiobiotin synthase [Moraxella caviae]|uniref:ATP-dependent dethiobiotin synthetase BioD n=1 Tax=Moraxella caviae TaxID=34060 RepID=A0A1T0A1I7_9GAMM|nr:dethiobiotin synthase [Moraxella caviae]OOR89642.1 dethiobiotin synthase [Moraxella caviae]STZ10331.1 ATP-dependent dethiobiotin synthetase BioD 1 [Moraxella caviae]VEW10439.1 ATP-dependent dethiobiotin synthetase BioD 1 [Moraxella caviae]
MTTYFITGIDTDAGKSYATGILAKSLLACGVRTTTQKLVQTGDTTASTDIQTHRKLMGIPPTADDIAGLSCPFIFAKPASPHLAARLENRTLCLDTLTKATNTLAARHDVLLLEGAGGVLVPLTKDVLTLDYIARHQYPAIVVTSARLGSINHTLLTLEAISARKLPLHAVIFNAYFDNDTDISRDTFGFLREFLDKHYPHALLLTLPDISKNPEFTWQLRTQDW